MSLGRKGCGLPVGARRMRGGHDVLGVLATNTVGACPTHARVKRRRRSWIEVFALVVAEASLRPDNRADREETMNNEQKLLVQKTFEMVAPIADVAAGLFYGRLFEVDPSLKPLFRGDMKDQGKKLMSTLKVAVQALDRLDALIPTVQALGRRHLAYGVRDDHYDTVGAALLWTLEKGLGEAFTPEVHEAWATVYGVLAKVMKDAANEVAPLSLRTPLSRRGSAHRMPAVKRPSYRPPMGRPSMPPGSRMPASIQALYGGANSQAAPSSKSGASPSTRLPRISNPPTIT
ncbi:hypothetical protein KEG38_26335 [Polyangium jinanense]|uniref:Globin domain-containing protein n=2 Tax=Polyangium jinanense TaxID=2829994 RepID=A0A9X3XCK9_9BACT|nr:hypothetical protein [Polyangium jinanense]MDC3988209.1 hypothetical protein [Polyangium jinanense]